MRRQPSSGTDNTSRSFGGRLAAAPSARLRLSAAAWRTLLRAAPAGWGSEFGRSRGSLLDGVE